MSKIKLQEEDFAYLYNLLSAPVTDFDCGKVCAACNDGIPFCCEVNVVVPILYKNEFKYVNKCSTLWKRFKPEDKHDRKLVKDCGYDDVMAVCLGHKDCDRSYRSIVCRTFPFYPFIEKNSNFLGLTYNYDFEDECILLQKPNMINKDYIKQSLEAWTYIFDRDDAEFDALYNLSRQIERQRKSKRKSLHVISREGVIIY